MMLPVAVAVTVLTFTPLTDPAASPPADEWSFTDGSGQTVTLDEVPADLVMHASSAAALIPLGIRPVALFADQPVADDPQLRGLDLDGIEIVGEQWGQVNIEAVAALDPDLIVAEYWPIEGGYSGMEEGSTHDLMTDIAPVVGVEQGPSVAAMIRDYERFAESLGADPDAPDIAAERARFEDAVEAFTDALEAKPDLTVLAVSPSPEALYVAVPSGSAELSDFVSWGMHVIEPEPDPAFPYWETLSWENAATYQADLIIVDDRRGDTGLAAALEQPTWQLLDAAAAGAIADWPAFWLRNYTAYADQLEELTAAVAAADEHLVD